MMIGIGVGVGGSCGQIVDGTGVDNNRRVAFIFHNI